MKDPARNAGRFDPKDMTAKTAPRIALTAGAMGTDAAAGSVDIIHAWRFHGGPGGVVSPYDAALVFRGCI